MLGKAIDNYLHSTPTVELIDYAKTYEDEENQSELDNAHKLKANVVMQHLIGAADVGPNMKRLAANKEISDLP